MPIGAGCHCFPLPCCRVVPASLPPDQHGDAGGRPTPGDAAAKPADMKSRIVRFLPRNVVDKPGWANDVVTALTTQGLTVSDHNDLQRAGGGGAGGDLSGGPVVPNLNKIAWKEINARAGKLLIPEFMVRTALPSNPPLARAMPSASTSFCTEREMSEIFEDMIGSVPMGKQLFGNLNPVRTGGPMQVGKRRLCRSQRPWLPLSREGVHSPRGVHSSGAASGWQ